MRRKSTGYSKIASFATTDFSKLQLLGPIGSQFITGGDTLGANLAMWTGGHRHEYGGSRH